MEFLTTFFEIVGLLVTLFVAIFLLLVASGLVKVGIDRREDGDD